MNIYDAFIYPKLLKKSMESENYHQRRKELCSNTHGTVVEIGFGFGANLPFYPQKVSLLYAVDIRRDFFEKRTSQNNTFPIKYIDGISGEYNIPSLSIDIVISSYSLCSIKNTPEVLNEIKRVLKKGGEFYFLEHGAASNVFVLFIQKIISRITKITDSGCQIHKDIVSLLEHAGFNVEIFSKTKRGIFVYEYYGKATL